MPRYVTEIGKVLECYHLDRDNGTHLSTITIMNYDLGPEEFAEALVMAAGWFRQVSAGQVAPAKPR